MNNVTPFLNRYPRWIALFAGAASATGFAPLNLWPVTLVCFALFMCLVAEAQSARRAAMIGWLFGVGHFTIGNNWIAVAFTFQAAMPAWLGWVAVVALALYLAVYPALCAGGARWIGQRVGGATAGVTQPFIMAFAGCWIITEWLRSWVFTGFSWNPLGASFQSQLELARAAKIVGTYGLSALVIGVAGIILLVLNRQWRAMTTCLIVFAAIWLTGSIFHSKSLNSGTRQPELTIVQPNISQADKYALGYEALNFAKLARYSRPLPNQGPRLLLWPEAAIPDYLESGYPYRYYQSQPGESAVGARLRLTTLMGSKDILLTGSNRLIFDKQGQLTAARNSMTAMDAEGNILGDYDKAHLVPYGEYLPLKWLLTPLGLSRLVPGDIDFLPGPGAQTMTLMLDGRPVKIGLQICYEIIFSGQVVDSKNRPDFLFNPSNDAWFGEWGPPQHLAQARLRAIEEGLPVIRATPTGISAVIDADGQIVTSLGHHKAGRIDARLPAAKAPTLFSRFGNILPVGLALLLIALAFLPLARTRTSR